MHPPPRQVYHLGFSYYPLGCYTDNANRMLPISVPINQAYCSNKNKDCRTVVNLPACAAAAKAKGCTVFGLQV